MITKFIIFSIALILLLITAKDPSKTPPGTRVTIRDEGFKNLIDSILPVINSQFADVDIPDIHTDQHVSVLGHVTVDLTNIQIKSFKIGGGAITTNNPNIIKGNLNTINFQVSGNWKWRRIHHPHTSDHGSMTASPKNGGATLTIALDVHPHSGLLKATLTECNAGFSDFSIHISGKMSFIYDLFLSLFKSTLTKTINKTMTEVLKDTVQKDLDDYLKSIPTTEYMGGGNSRMTIDFKTNNITATHNYVTVANDLTAYNNKTGEKCPHIPVQLPNNSEYPAGFQLFLAETAISCSSWVSYTNGALIDTVDSSSEEYKPYIPQIANKYPPGTRINIELSAVAEPAFNLIKGEGAVLNITMNGKFIAMTNDTTEGVYLASLELDINSGLDLIVEERADNISYISGDVSTLNVQLKPIDSKIGDLDLTKLELLATLIGPSIKIAINTVISKGFAIHTGTGIKLVKPVLHIENGYLVIGCDVGYNPPPKTKILKMKKHDYIK